MPLARFRLLAGADALRDYRFNTRIAVHRFCRHCGAKSFYVPRSHPDGIDVSVRGLDEGTIASFRIVPFDERDDRASVPHEVTARRHASSAITMPGL